MPLVSANAVCLYESVIGGRHVVYLYVHRQFHTLTLNYHNHNMYDV